ncbi:hypothetical protein JCM6882_004982 [Rhodosporidiobolus microsporus]
MGMAGTASTLRSLVARALSAHPAPPPSRVPFFSSSLSHPPTSHAFFTPARSIHTFAHFSPSYLPPVSASAGGSSSPFSALRTAFHRSSFSPRAPRPAGRLPGWSGATAGPSGRREFATSAAVRALRPYLGRGRGGGGAYGRRPPPGWKDRLDALPGIYIIGGLIAVNVAVFLTWNYANQLMHRFRDASLLRTMTKNFTVSWQNLSSGRVWTLLTSAFSHEGTSHFLVNMVSLWFMGGAAASVLGNTGFLSLYLFSGFVSSAFSALFARYVTNNQWYSAHGASGAVFGAASFFACAFPREKFLLFFVVPVPAWLCVGGLFAWDLYSGLARTGGTTDSMGHVGGAIAGALFFLRKIGRL